MSFVIIAKLDYIAINESVLFISGKHRSVVKQVLLVSLPLAIIMIDFKVIN